MTNPNPQLFKDCFNPQKSEVIIVIGDRLPDFLRDSEDRIVIIDASNLFSVARYHTEGYKKQPNQWLKSICCTEFPSYDVIEKSSRFHVSQLIGFDGKVIIEKCNSRVEYLLRAYEFTEDINIFGLAKAHHLGSNSSSVSETIQDKVSRFYAKVNSIITMSEDSFNALMRKSNQSYVDNIISASIDFNPQKFGITTHRGSSFNSFDISSFITHPLKFVGNTSTQRKPLPTPEITLIKAGTGTGKTELLIKILLAYHLADKKVIVISNLRSVVGSIKVRTENEFDNTKKSLGLPSGGKLGIVTSDANLCDLETASHLITTLKSATKEVMKHRLKGADLIILDESEKLFESIYATDENYLSKNEKDVLKTLVKEFLSGEQSVILADADLTDQLTTNIVRSFASHRRVVAGVISPAAIKCNRLSKSNIIAKLGEWASYENYLLSHRLKPQHKNFIVCDSKKSIESWLISSGYFSKEDSTKADFKSAIDDRVLAIVKNDDSGKSLLDEQTAFLKDPSSEIHKYDTVIVSPVLKEGFDINANHAQRVIVFAAGVLTPKELIQFASRLRTAKKIEFALKKPMPSHSINYYRHAYSNEERFESRLAKHRSVLLSNLHYSLHQTLRHEGFSVDGTQEVLLKGDVEFTSSPRSISEFRPEVKAMLRGERDTKLNSQEARKTFEAVGSLSTILCLDKITNEPVKINLQSSENLSPSIESMFHQLLENAEVVNHILPEPLKIKSAWKGQTMRGITRKVNQLYLALGFSVQRTNKGKAENITRCD
ncbi:DEAD/DEAH box helicase family protein [Vibrio parahaemolyticus]|uniref:DEAD/DEAH box helicase family protein n=1 Tax=Vibrio parahaemolyticus TaxID=670 RepID=UPI00235E680C|nr:DEAD/DEAH box helicase family protein [Vibrio parahaemolyticus]